MDIIIFYIKYSFMVAEIKQKERKRKKREIIYINKVLSLFIFKLKSIIFPIKKTS